MRKSFVFLSVLSVVVVALLAYSFSTAWLWSLIIIMPVILLGLRDMAQQKHSLLRNFPVLGHMRYIAEWMRPKVYQYFVEPDTDGRPFSRTKRSIIYQRAKDVLDTSPFGTQLLVYDEGYEWMNHSINARDPHMMDPNPRILIGGRDCKKPYSSSVLNISAMSFGSLSKSAVMAMNGGAAIGNFGQNTGEGGISPYHNKFGGDLVYQFGTGYFGCRSEDGNFDPEKFKVTAAADNVKMIEIKLSQGAKPGHGGILPGKKVTREIAEIRGIKPFEDVISPPYHKAFDSPIGLLKLVKQCRDLSGGKPVGFKFCVGHKSEVLAICKAMLKTGVKPDFISVDGGEGGTGAAPLEFADSVGMPYKEGLSFVYNALVGFNLKKEITLITAGKIATGFDMFKAMALGADVCVSARAMMMAVGCIQALECNLNTCPVGVATQDEELNKGLKVADKKYRVANFHKETVMSFVELMAAAGLDSPEQINRTHIYQRVDQHLSKSYYKLYPYIPESCLLSADSVPRNWKKYMSMADANSFTPRFDSLFIESDHGIS